MFAFFLLTGCEDRKHKPDVSYSQTAPAESTKNLQINSLVRAVQSAIIPSYQDWVLYEHGTYIIIDHIDSVDNVETHCNGLLKKHTLQLTDDSSNEENGGNDNAMIISGLIDDSSSFTFDNINSPDPVVEVNDYSDLLSQTFSSHNEELEVVVIDEWEEEEILISIDIV